MLAVTHFVTQFTHVSKHFGVKNTKKNRENCFKNVVSEIYKKNEFCPQNPPKIVNVFYGF